MKHRLYCSLGMAALSTLVLSAPRSSTATEPSKSGKPVLPNCPVMGEPINLAVSTPTDDGPVFFCCRGCDKKYKADPAKFADVVASQRKFLGDRPKVQVKCPVSGEPVNPKVMIEKDGKKIGFCCKDCVAKYEADPAKYKSALANSYIYQTRCPVTGEGINPNTSIKLPDGETIYTCCKGCIKKLLAEPAKYAPELESQGYGFDPAKISKGKENVAKQPAEDADKHDHDHEDHEGHDHD